jgi:hypothetical protein
MYPVWSTKNLFLKNEYLAAENRILRSHLPKRLRLTDEQRSTLAKIGKRVGRKLLGHVAVIAKPDTILGWYRRLVAQKFDRSKHRSDPGRPAVSPEVEKLVVQMATENPGWGYDRIVGALANLDTRSRIKPLETFCVVMAYHRHRNEPRIPPGRISFPRIWPFWPVLISSQWKCSPGEDSQPIMFCSFCI